MADNDALQESEQDFSIPGQDEADSGGFASGGSLANAQPSGGPSPSPVSQTPSSASVSAGSGPSEMPKASGRALILGNLLKSILSGAMAGAAQGSPAMARGFGAQQQARLQQEAKQRQQQKDQQDAMLKMDAHQMNVVKFHTAQMQQAIMANQMPHLDDAHNQKIVDSLEQSTAFDRKEGLMQDEQEVDGEGMEAYSTAVKLAGQLNGKAGAGSQDRYKVGITDGSDLAHLKFNVYKANMNGSTTRDVFTGMDADGNPQYKSMTGKYVDLDALESKNRLTVTQDATKETLKDLHKTLGNQKPPETQDEADFRLSQLNTVLQMHPDPVAKQLATNEVANIKKNYAALPKTQQQAKERQARAGAEIRGEVSLDTKTKAGNIAGEQALRYADDYLKSKQYDGPGDEALLEKFFELAKPSSGFRMTKQQIDLLTTARSWIEGAKAKAGHVEGGVLFSDQQRQQIANTMQRLEKAKTGTGGPATKPIYASAPGKPRQVSTDGGRTWQPVQ